MEGKIDLWVNLWMLFLADSFFLSSLSLSFLKRKKKRKKDCGQKAQKTNPWKKQHNSWRNRPNPWMKESNKQSDINELVFASTGPQLRTISCAPQACRQARAAPSYFHAPASNPGAPKPLWGCGGTTI
ncbi:hypothetical protein [Photobacterium sp. OFAV2-7]|uniref:hypothetical protein n=1 Tax=Photobacterium sp. OFAV2-7 TaxID=2917748 RepID=UPI001EF64E05|nr:hypothetical protein [Photobacterium sp. OFAV2-7]MCG7587531.1 hypothetical protein [Photobacterium sp. OFAV2-7]